MKTWFDIFIFGLATWRISSLLVHEKGPMNLFEGLRTLAGIQYEQVGDSPEWYKSVPDTFMAQLLDCVWCCSVWVAAAFWVLNWFQPLVAFGLASVFSISAVAIVVNLVIRRGE